MPKRIDSGSPGPSSTPNRDATSGQEEEEGPRRRRKYTPLGEGGAATMSENQFQSICG